MIRGIESESEMIGMRLVMVLDIEVSIVSLGTGLEQDLEKTSLKSMHS